MKYIIKTIFIGALVITSVNTYGQYYNEALTSLVQAAKHYELSELPEASKAFCLEIEASAKKSIKQMSDQDIKKSIDSLAQISKNKTYDSLTVEDKKLIIEKFISNFFDKNNTDSLNKFVQMLIFIIMNGQTLDELKPIIDKHQKDLEDLSKKKGNGIVILNQFSTKAQAIYNSIPESVKQSLQSIANNTRGKGINLDNKIQPSLPQKAAAIKVSKPEHRELVALAIAAFHYRINQK